MPYSKKTISERIRHLRGGKSQESFSNEIGISFRAYRYYESGDRTPPGAVLSKLADIGGVTVDWILTGKNAASDRVAESIEPYQDDVTKKILDMLGDMDKNQKRQVLRFIEGQKLLADHEKKLKEG